MVSSNWMVRPPWSFGRARVFRKWATFVDSTLDELIAQDLFLPRSFARSSFLECAGSVVSDCVLPAWGRPTYSSATHAEGCSVVAVLAASACDVAGV
jgi:hypothetical protein